MFILFFFFWGENYLWKLERERKKEEIANVFPEDIYKMRISLETVSIWKSQYTRGYLIRGEDTLGG